MTRSCMLLASKLRDRSLGMVALCFQRNGVSLPILAMLSTISNFMRHRFMTRSPAVLRYRSRLSVSASGREGQI